jgi:hypothetical protein
MTPQTAASKRSASGPSIPLNCGVADAGLATVPSGIRTVIRLLRIVCFGSVLRDRRKELSFHTCQSHTCPHVLPRLRVISTCGIIALGTLYGRPQR